MPFQVSGFILQAAVLVFLALLAGAGAVALLHPERHRRADALRVLKTLLAVIRRMDGRR